MTYDILIRKKTENDKGKILYLSIRSCNLATILRESEHCT